MEGFKILKILVWFFIQKNLYFISDKLHLIAWILQLRWCCMSVTPIYYNDLTVKLIHEQQLIYL